MTEAQFASTFGRTNRDIIAELWDPAMPPADADALGARKEVIYRNLIGAKPFLGLLRTDEIAATLDRAGFAVLSDTGARDWSARFRDGPAGLAHDIGERLVVGERRSR
jgi:hypothetical protein